MQKTPEVFDGPHQQLVDCRALPPPFVSRKLVLILASLLSFTVSVMPRRLRYVPVLQSYHNRYTAVPGSGYLNRLHQTKCGVFIAIWNFFCLKLSINNDIVGLVHKTHITRTCLMYHAACRVEFQPFKRLYLQLTFFDFL